MNTTILTAGLACLIAAVIGGGLKAFGMEIPVLKSAFRQVALGALGIILIVAAIFAKQEVNSNGEGSGQQEMPKSGITVGTTATKESKVDNTDGENQDATLTLFFEGTSELPVREAVENSVRTPDNNENRGNCPNNVGKRDGKYCTSRTPVILTTTAPRFWRNAKVICRGGACPRTESGPAAISADGLVTKDQCGSPVSAQASKDQSGRFTINKKCARIASIRWVLPDGRKWRATVR